MFSEILELNVECSGSSSEVRDEIFLGYDSPEGKKYTSWTLFNSELVLSLKERKKTFVLQQEMPTL